MTSTTQKLAEAFERLMDIQRYTGQISFSDIRRTLLSLKGLCHRKFYDPPTVWGVAVCDIGYVRDDTFIFLCNARDDAELGVTSEEVFTVKCDPLHPVLTEQISTDWIQWV
jgi:hypothetical protein